MDTWNFQEGLIFVIFFHVLEKCQDGCTQDFKWKKKNSKEI